MTRYSWILTLCLLLANPVLADDLEAYRLGEACDDPELAPGYSLPGPGLGRQMLPGLPPAGTAHVGLPMAMYLPLFQPRHAPAWPGNLKKLQILGGRAVDAMGQSALEDSGERTGQLKLSATTLWTRVDQPFGESPDGGDLKRGGAGQQLMLAPVSEVPVPGQRRVLLEPLAHSNGELADIPPLLADAASARELSAELGVRDETEARAVLRWARGLPPAQGDVTAPWRLGAILHSQPVVVDYGPDPAGAEGARLRRILFGTQWGFLHMIADGGGGAEGREIFAYLPRQYLGNLAVLSQVQANTVNFVHGLDGSPVVLRRDVDGDGRIEPVAGDWVRVAFGMRRGGRGYQMLDITDPDGPPRLLWRIRPQGDYARLGLGFSKPVSGRVLYEDGEREVLIFGAGYHGGRDGEGKPLGKDAADDPDPVGNAILVVDAATGKLVWQASANTSGSAAPAHRQPAMRHSIPSQVAVLRNHRGLIYRAYLGDSGGQVWRVDLPPGREPGQRERYWRARLFADLGELGGAPRLRRFFHAPAVFQARDTAGTPFDGIVLASGNQAQPLDLQGRDYLFYLRDYQVGPTAGNVTPIDAEALPDLADCAHDIPLCRSGRQAGWKMALEGPGEKGLSRPHLAGGRLWLTSYLPPQRREDCERSPGRNRLYRLQLLDEGPPARVRMLTLAPGLPASIARVGWQAWVPAGPVPVDWLPEMPPEGADDASLPRQLLPAAVRRLVPLYWRDLERE
ncbi:MAG: hypothetical protein CME40_06335 [Haliea sp.]|nr:hypothetical protein [Haliea sp.]|tara:strand:+ start:108001 stop:110214 length:2214 start_codon:yes stop_codon:yes gene_type:complete